VKALSPSALFGLFTVRLPTKAEGPAVAVEKGGHWAGSAPGLGNKGQLCCGEKKIVIVQLCCGRRVKVDPGGFAHVSSSIKLGKPLKSLKPARAVPKSGRHDSDIPLRVDPAGSVLVSVMVCEAVAEPTNWLGKLREAGDNVKGCEQALPSPPIARQMLPRSVKYGTLL
jgi:hypothetical protein